MAEQVGPPKVARSKNLEFSTTKTQRGQTVDINSVSTNYVIDTHGEIFKISDPSPESATIALIGGLDTFVNEKETRNPVFYITQKQKNTVYAILRELSINTDSAQVTCSDSDVFDKLVSSAYFNYCG